MDGCCLTILFDMAKKYLENVDHFLDYCFYVGENYSIVLKFDNRIVLSCMKKEKLEKNITNLLIMIDTISLQIQRVKKVFTISNAG